MRDLYTRLSAAGFDKGWVRNSVLPDWWDDELAEVPYNRAAAECAIAGQLGYSLALLRDRDANLHCPEVAHDVCFKRNPKVNFSRVVPSLQVVRRAAKLVSESVGGLPPFSAGRTAAEIRKAVRVDGRPVTLGRLLDYCWGAGVVVIGVSSLPKNSAKFDGVAMFAGGHPVIILASGKDGPAWLAFDLAHELGHLMRGHVRPGDKLLVDARLTDNVTDDGELEADEFALELLTGSPAGVEFKRDAIKANEIGPAAADYVLRERPDLDPGMVVLSYCKSTSYWGVAKGGLESLGAARGGHVMVAQRLASRLSVDLLTESESRFLAAVCHLPDATVTDEQSLVAR